MTGVQQVGVWLLVGAVVWLIFDVLCRHNIRDYIVLTDEPEPEWTDDNYLDLYDEVFALETLNAREAEADRNHFESRRP